mmetsp:Transcript_19266/g.53563  ORF Transcript_19266/g.53563 Transcript_19266/m.53563 type:complete len:85 (+) Transcript_19266:1066-1320(+)
MVLHSNFSYFKVDIHKRAQLGTATASNSSVVMMDFRSLFSFLTTGAGYSYELSNSSSTRNNNANRNAAALYQYCKHHSKYYAPL